MLRDLQLTRADFGFCRRPQPLEKLITKTKIQNQSVHLFVNSERKIPTRNSDDVFVLQLTKSNK